MRRLITSLALAVAVILTGHTPDMTHHTAVAQVTAPVIRVMPLGDSITAGFGSTTGAGYRLPLWNSVAAQSRYSVDYVGSQNAGTVPDADHEGHRGYFISQIRDGIDAWLTTAQPTYVLLHIGINDLAWGADPQTAADQLVGLIDQIYTRQPGVIIILMGLIPTSAGLQTQAAAYNDRARTIVRAHFYYVDAPALTTAEMVDELHPNDAGYQRIGDTLYTALNRAEVSRQRAGTSP